MTLWKHMLPYVAYDKGWINTSHMKKHYNLNLQEDAIPKQRANYYKP